MNPGIVFDAQCRDLETQNKQRGIKRAKEGETNHRKKKGKTGKWKYIGSEKYTCGSIGLVISTNFERSSETSLSTTCPSLTTPMRYICKSKKVNNI